MIHTLRRAELRENHTFSFELAGHHYVRPTGARRDRGAA